MRWGAQTPKIIRRVTPQRSVPRCLRRSLGVKLAVLRTDSLMSTLYSTCSRRHAAWPVRRSMPTASGLLRRVRRARTVARCRLPHSRACRCSQARVTRNPCASAIQRFKYRAAPELCGALAALARAQDRPAGHRAEPRVGAGATSPATPGGARLQSSGAAWRLRELSRAQRTGASMCAGCSVCATPSNRRSALATPRTENVNAAFAAREAGRNRATELSASCSSTT